MKKIYIAILSLGVSAGAFAQNVEEAKTKNIEEVVLVSNRTPTKISDIPGTVWVVPQERLDVLISTGVPLKEMLGQLVPSLDIGAQGRTNFGQNMRGRRMLVMIDGVSLNSLRGVSRQLDSIDPFNIARIEVLSGASSIYGGNATGGIINIVTKMPKKEGLSGETNFSYQSSFMGKEAGDHAAAQSIAYKNNKAFARLGFAYKKNGGFYGADKEQIFTDVTQTDLQYNESIDVLATAGYKFNKNHQLSATGQYYNSEFSGDRVLSFGKNFGSILTGNADLLEMQNGFTLDKKIGSKRYMGTLSYRGKNILGGQSLHVQLSARSEKFGFFPFPKILKFGGKPLPMTSSSQQSTYYKGVKAVLHKNWNKLHLTYGVDADFETFEAFRNIYKPQVAIPSGGLTNELFATTGRYPDINSKSYAGYLQAKYNINSKWSIKGGVRYQFNDIRVSDFIGTNQQSFLAFGVGKSADKIKGGDSTYDVFLGNLGVLFKPTRKSQLWATFSQGAELADPAKFYGVGKYDLNTATANWDLKSSVNVNDTKLQGIVTNQLELGYRINSNGIKAQIAGFYSTSDKSIKLDDNLIISVEDLKLRNLGVEAEVSHTMDNGFYIGVNALVVKSQIEQNNKWVNQSIFIASPSKVTTYFGYQKNKFSLRFQNQKVFDLKGESNQKIEGYHLSNLMLGYQLPVGRFSVGIQNVFNTDYQTVWSKRAQALYGGALQLPELFYYKGRGRTFNINYTYTF